VCTIWKTFANNNYKLLEESLIRFAKQINSPAASKVSKEKYLLLCESLGTEPNPEAMPLELEDFPDIVGQGLQIFNDLRDTYVPGEYPCYNGKDLSSLEILYNIYEIHDVRERQIILRVINIFDNSAVIAARKKLETLRKQNAKKPQGASRT